MMRVMSYQLNLANESYGQVVLVYPVNLANELPNRHHAFFGTFGVRKELQAYFASFFHLFGAPSFDITVDKLHKSRR